MNANLQEAENQCIRGGAVLVNGHHQWNRVAAGETHVMDMSKKDKEEADKKLKSKREATEKVRTQSFR